MEIKKLKKFASQNYILLIIAVSLSLVLLASLTKTTTNEENYIYAKIKIDRGLWWIRTQRPSIWYSTAIQKGEKEVNLLGNPIAEVVTARSYPFYEENQIEPQYNIYITAKLAVNTNRTGELVFKRSPVSVGSPIDIELPSVVISGTVIGIENEFPQNEYVENTVYLTKRFAFPWEYDEIEIGDTFNDGEKIVFEVLEKSKTDTFFLAQDAFGNLTSTTTEPGRYVTVRARVKARNVDGKLIFGEEQMLIPGSPFFVITDNYTYNNFVVSRVLD